MLYKKNSAKTLDPELFRNPTSEYRATPFWAWNTKLEKDVLLRQIDQFKEMGFGGFHMHTRKGMATDYMGEEFMELVKNCTDKAEAENMLAWLYDEDTWPSGFAGGKVSKNKRLRRKRIGLFTEDNADWHTPRDEALEKGAPYFITCYDIVLDSEGYLESYSRISLDDKAKGKKFYAFVVTDADTPRFNNQAYIDTTDKEALELFIEYTYEPYKKAVGDRFDKTVPAIFTDEPAMEGSSFIIATPETNEKILRIWSRTLEKDYMDAYNADILDTLPELFWNKKDRSDSITKYRYFDLMAERFSKNFAKTLGDWCKANGISFTGHLLNEPALVGQSASCGETMRHYQYFGLPGIDMLCNLREYTTAKQTQSCVHQYGKEGMLSELYGVTNWDFDFRGHKLQGDWQAALGVTVRVPHLAWVSMKGDAKRDYPASIGYQSPWYKEYSYIENHFARLNTALTRGTPVVKVGVIHPVESFWIMTGPMSQCSVQTETLESNFKNITKWLLESHLDFNFICESTLSDIGNADTRSVGKMNYDAIVIPACLTLRKTTLEYLEAFKNAGGKVIFMGECPQYTDGIKSSLAKPVFDACENISFDNASLVNALESVRTVGIKNASGRTARQYLYCMREDTDCHYLFIARSTDPDQCDVQAPQNIIITVKGEFIPCEYDTITGDIKSLEFEHKNGNTVIHRELNAYDSLLVRLSQDSALQNTVATEYEITDRFDFKKCVKYTLSEPNVLLVDRAEYAFDDGEWHGEEDMLQITRKFRRHLGLTSDLPQPYVIEDAPKTHTVHLRFEFESEIEYNGALLAIEDADIITVTFNGEKVQNTPVGYFTDEAIKTLPLPAIKKGTNCVEIDVPFGGRSYVEWCYILGDFGVRVMGCEKTVTELPEKIGFGDITSQGFPFYGANVTYHFDVDIPCDSGISIRASNYRGALVGVDIDGERADRIVFPPYKSVITNVKQGRHTVSLTLFGNRHNSFGALHLVNEKHTWFGPAAWYTTGDDYCYEYRLKRMGILKSPVVEIIKEK